MKVKAKISKAKRIIADIWRLTGEGNDWELNKATDAMYSYIKEIEDEARKVKK